MRKSCFCAALLPALALAQMPVTIRVNTSEIVAPFKAIHTYFGYDEPNYTYMKNGRKLVGELAELSGSAVYIRTHFMLASGDGTKMGILREAVATHAESWLAHVAVCRSNADRLYDLEQIDAHRLGEARPLLDKSDVHSAIRVFEHLGGLGGRR